VLLDKSVLNGMQASSNLRGFELGGNILKED